MIEVLVCIFVFTLITIFAFLIVRSCENIFKHAIRFTIATYFKALAKHNKGDNHVG